MNTGSSGTIKAGASGTVTGSDVNLRRGAGTNYSVVTRMNYGTKLKFVDGKRYNTNWYKVKLSNGTTGYIHKDYVSASGGSRDLNNVNKQNLIDALCSTTMRQVLAIGDFCTEGLTRRKSSSTAIMTVTVSTITTTSVSHVIQTQVLVSDINFCKEGLKMKK